MKKTKTTLLTISSVIFAGLLPASLTSCGETKQTEYTLKSGDIQFGAQDNRTYAESLSIESEINPDKLIIDGAIFPKLDFLGFNYSRGPGSETPNFFNEKNSNIKTLEIDFTSTDGHGIQFNGASEFGFYLPTLEGSNVEHLILRPFLNNQKYSFFLITPFSSIRANIFSTNSEKLRIDFYGSLRSRELAESTGGEFTKQWIGDGSYKNIFNRKDGTAAVIKPEIHVLETEDIDMWADTYLFEKENIIADLKL